jgi:tetratricopeptide (TPR) repeat protein
LRALTGYVRHALLAALVASSLGACAATTFQPRVTADPSRTGGSLYGDFLVATFAGNTRDARVAAGRYLAALQADPTNPTLLERAFIFSIAAGDMDQAAALAPMVVQANPQSDLAPLVQGVVALKTKRYADARAFFAASHPGGAVDLMGALTLAWTHVGLNDPATSRRLLTPPADPASAIFVNYHRARLEEVLGDTAAAGAAFAAADAATGGKSLTVALGYASWLQGQGRTDEAAAALQRLLESNAGNPVATAALARLKAAQPIARAIATPQQGAAEGFYGIASAVGDGEGADAAIVYLRLAQYLDPQNDGALAFLGGAMERAGRTDEAIELYREVPDTSPFYVTAQVSAADLLDGRDRTEEAVRVLEQLERIEATSGLAASALGDVYRNRQRWPEAVDAYSRAIARSGPPYAKESWPLFYARGIANERARRWPAAETDFRQALQMSPDQPLVLNYLAYSWIERGERIEEALAMLQRAVDQRPDDGYIIDSLGWAYYRLGRYDKALEVLEQAIQYSPYEPTLNEHLGDVYWRVGRQREARFQWSHALTLKPEANRIPILQVKLREGLEAGEAMERRQASTDTSTGAPLLEPATP